MRFPLYFLTIFFLCIIARTPLCSCNDTILECLNNHSNPSHPISSAIYTPNNSSFSLVLREYLRNLRFNESNTKKPLFIVTPTHISHIQLSILCANKHDLQMKIRSGGHDFEGVSYVSDVPFFILDMFNFRSINVSIEDETAWIEVGATSGEVYYLIANKSNVHGFPAGVCTTIGMGGHIGGGGYGNMMRKYGLTVDNVIDAKLIDVKGNLLDRKSMGEDLFWAITGGGAYSFGVVLSYKIKLVRVPPKVTVFRVTRTYDQNLTNIVYRHQRVSNHLDNNLFIRLTLGVANKTISATFNSLFLGDSKTLLSTMNKSFPELGLNQEDCTEMAWIESVLFYTNFPAKTPLEALLIRQPQGLNYFKIKSDYLQTPMPKEGIEFIFKKMVELERVALTFNPYGGSMAEIPSTAKPFPHRSGNIAMIQYAISWLEEGDKAAERNLGLIRQLYEHMTPFVSENPRAAFLNYRDLDLGINHNNNGPQSYSEGMEYGLKYFKENFDRLVKIKSKVDPQNFFRNEQSIPIFPQPS
ncbi:PREDICTED: berberine bridge enzyme-like 8 isoform X1 [Ipomoea nil]|uniref:berberine bridge enzyme-like 8 isoform X1 n=1 Tax=Ipomoea nil TaxID=35883 RepID=UPI000901C00B|nr:PREDICTED: berberine bridge enzyme-like 8 isoform X1 [Ipomoea nil]